MQCIPCGGGGGRWLTAGAAARARPTGLLPRPPVPQRGAGKGGTPLLHGRAGARQPTRGRRVHRRRQPYLQRLLELTARPLQELLDLLPGCQQLQRGKRLKLFL